MAKTKAEFQEIIQHQAEIDPVRTHIRIHCRTEPLLKKTLRSVDLNETEFNQIFQTSATKATDKKTGWLQKKNKRQLLKLIVGTHLNILHTRAKLDDFKEKLHNKEFEQHEIVKLKTAHPAAAQATMDLSRTISPEDAVKFLGGLNKNLIKLQSELMSCREEHEQCTQQFVEQYIKLLDEFDAELKKYHHTLSPKELNAVFKLLGDFNGNVT